MTLRYSAKSKTVVIDSLNGYQAAMPEENSLILHMHELLQYLNCQGAMDIYDRRAARADRRHAGPHRRDLPCRYRILLRYFEALRQDLARHLGDQEALWLA